MTHYLLRRLILLPITLFSIILVNFVIINLAPGEPVTITQISSEGDAGRQEKNNISIGIGGGIDDRYLQFREFYGLTLPILWNDWPWLTRKTIEENLWSLVHKKTTPNSPQEMSFKDYDSLRITLGDQARYIMTHLITIIEDPLTNTAIRNMGVRFFVRGGIRQGYTGENLTFEKKKMNQKIARDNQYLLSLIIDPEDSKEAIVKKIFKMRQWYEENSQTYLFSPSLEEKIEILFLETRFMKYMGRVIRLDFGTLRNDPNKTVISEVAKRFKYSLTLSLLPMFITFFLCTTFGFWMAYQQNHWPDTGLNLVFLVLYAIPVFIVAPFLIEKIALHHTFPLTHIPIPISGFTSPDAVYDQETTLQRLFDLLAHIALPLIAIMYGTLAAQARLSRTAVLEVLRQDYVRTAKAKGNPPFLILFRHVGRNAAITIATSIAGSLGAVLGGSLIVETLFGIDGFGKFFYDAVINRDYNVIMFSALAGSFLTLVGYLVGDLAYTWLDPRVTLE